jgi:hypothetical protein
MPLKLVKHNVSSAKDTVKMNKKKRTLSRANRAAPTKSSLPSYGKREIKALLELAQLFVL